jgi:hypothetical protein
MLSSENCSLIEESPKPADHLQKDGAIAQVSG